jgi:hypothetical protein
MLNLDIFDNRYIPEVDRLGRSFFPAYVRSKFQRDRYLARRDENRDKDPFETQIGYLGETGDNMVGD